MCVFRLVQQITAQKVAQKTVPAAGKKNAEEADKSQHALKELQPVILNVSLFFKNLQQLRSYLLL